MLGRFTVRPADDGSNRFGVWDGAVNGWRATDIDDETEAHRIASDLDVQYDAHGARPADAIRKVDPAQPVQKAQWQKGELDVWIRDNGEWLGRVRDKNGRVTWIPGTDLRPSRRRPRKLAGTGVDEPGVGFAARLPGRVDVAGTSYRSAGDLRDALRRAARAHGEHEQRTGEKDANWPDWYASYMVAEQAATELPT